MPSSSRKRSLLLSAALLSGPFLPASGALAQSADPATTWDVTNTGQPYRDVSFATTEGTWMSLDVSPDGKWIAFDLLGDIYRIPATGGDAVPIQSGSAMQYVPRFSPDGRAIAFVSDASGNNNLWIANADGSDARAVTKDERNLLMAPDWSPAGDTLAAVRIDAAYPNRWASQVILFPLDEKRQSGEGRVLVDTPANRRDVMEPRFSPDGRWVYYTERLNSPNIYIDGNHSNYGIKRREIATGKIEDVAAGFGGAMAAQLSRDGKTLAFLRRVMDKTVLFKLDLASGEQTAVHDGLDRDLQASYEVQGNYFPHFSWFPDNRHVAIWGRGKIMKVDMTSGTATEIPFRVQAKHRITDPLRFRQELTPAQFPVRSIRHLAPATDGALIFSGLGQLWRKIGDTAPTKLSPGDNFAFDPKVSAGDTSLVYIDWSDQHGSTLKIARGNGQGARTVASSPGIIRQPSLSPDGKSVVFRIQEPDVNMGGARAKPGIYVVPASGGTPRFVTAGDDAPIFSPDGQRIYFLRTARPGDSPAQALWSVNLDGLDPREHARSPDADTTELRISPDLRWIAFKDRQQVNVLPYLETGRPLIVSARSSEAAVHTLTDKGGYALAWSPDSKTLYWSLGADLYRYDVKQGGAAMPAPFASAGLTAKSDIPTGALAITNARIITMKGEEVIENGTIIVTGNRITAIGPADTVAIPAGAKRIDAASKTVMPGIIDAHGHLDCCWNTGATPKLKPPLYAALAFGVTTVFDPYPNELTSYQNTETTMAGITVGPRWIGTGAAVWGRPRQASNQYEPLDSYRHAQKLVERKLALGGTILKSYRLPGRRERQMLVKAAREGGLMVDGEGESHFYNNISMILDGHTNLEHNLPVQTYYSDLIQLMAAAKIHNTPTLVVTFGELMGENFMYQTTQSWKDPKIRTFVQEVSSGYSPLGTPYGAPPYVRGITTIQAADEIYDIGFRAVARSTKKLDDAGVVINAGSHGEVPGLSQHWEMQLLTEGGMGNARALRTGTINVAQTLGIDDQIGSIEVGKLADLIILDKNPLDDIRNTNTVRYTMVNGRLYDSATMNEIGNHERARPKFYWELQKNLGVDWNESWVRR